MSLNCSFISCYKCKYLVNTLLRNYLFFSKLLPVTMFEVIISLPVPDLVSANGVVQSSPPQLTPGLSPCHHVLQSNMAGLYPSWLDK